MLQPSEYDLVLANINRNVLIKYADLFADLLKSKGKLMLSGLLLSDEAKILQVYNRAGFILVQKNAMKDWLLLVLEVKDHKIEKENLYIRKVE
jgi:ribosomal protein L11 methyltransferase